MKLEKQTPQKVLKAFLKQKPLRSEIDLFKKNLIILLDKITLIEKRVKDESEEHLKNDVRDFLRDTYYKETSAINTKDKKDLVIHISKTTDSEVGVIIEAKRPSNVNEMVSVDNANKKALQELILYYLDERNKADNNQLKHLIITNVNEWYIIDANFFDKHIYRNAKIKKLYETKVNDKKDNPFFYEEIAKILSKADIEIPCVYFDIRKYNNVLRNNKKEDDRELIALFKILSPQYLLKAVTTSDSNSLNEKFYKELLHIIGLEEAKEGSKNIIRRKKENRNTASLIEATIEAINTEDVLHRLPDQSAFGETKEDRIFNVSLELCITWINRILFLKLLEGQLITYHKENNDYRFLNTETINDFDELFKLFHRVLAVNINERTEAIKAKYKLVPYLNSSLFEISELEDYTIKINSLDNSGQLELISTTILKDVKKKTDKLPILSYLFQFLDAYDFASEGNQEVQEDNKTIINASVLGKVFEKINGYKDGSIFTPAFITMYMCKQSIRLAVVQKFNDAKKWELKNFNELYNKIENKKEANQIINSLKICDPAVGSGHFLVSALNEIIAIKSELGVLMDEKNKTLRDYEIEIVNDELIITDENGNIFAYNPANVESNRVQKTLFQEKQAIIENCLFGVDINPNSVKICRLRLWIELLKNAYYKVETNYTELETLPNIDINIKCGNSLLSRFTLNADLAPALKSIKYDIKAYRGFVSDYKNEKSREVKRQLEKIINGIKIKFKEQFYVHSKENKDLQNIRGQYLALTTANVDLFGKKVKGKDFEIQKQRLEKQLDTFEKAVDDIKNNVLYKNAFEWRFEFPEVLNNNGEFEGFDLIIGNPPYVYRNYEYEGLKRYFTDQFYSTEGNFDLFRFFVEKSILLAKENCFIILIIPNTFLTAKSYNKLRNFLLSNSTVIEIFDLGENVFDGITVENVILQLQKVKTKSENTVIKIQRSRAGNFDELESEYVLNLQAIFELENSFNIYLNSETNSFVQKIRKDTVKLNEIAYCTVGINTGYIKDELTAKTKIDKTYHKMLSGRDIGINACDWKGEWIKYDKEFVDSFKDRGRSLPPEYVFKKEKILVQRTRRGLKRKLVCYYDTKKFYNLNRLSNIISTDKQYSLKYIHALLNSSLMDYYFNVVFNEYEVKPVHLAQLPIKKILPKEQKPFIDLVDKIIEAKQQDKDSTAYENKIDKLVYELYSITPEEQKIIEGTK